MNLSLRISSSLWVGALLGSLGAIVTPTASAQSATVQSGNTPRGEKIVIKGSTSTVEIVHRGPNGRFSKAFHAGWGRETVHHVASQPEGGIAFGVGLHGHDAHALPGAPTRDVNLPAYAHAVGVVPAYYTWYHAPRSTASVHVVGAGGSKEFRAAPRTVEPADAATDSPQESTESYIPEIEQEMGRVHGDPQARRWVEEGVQLFAARDYFGAAEAYRKAIPILPDTGLVRFHQALAQFALGDYEGAAYLIRRGLDQLPLWVESGQDLRAFYGDPVDFVDQRQALVAHLRVAPADVEAWVVKGYVDFLSGEIDGAEEAFRAVAAKRGDDPIAPHFLTQIESIRVFVAKQ